VIKEEYKVSLNKIKEIIDGLCCPVCKGTGLDSKKTIEYEKKTGTMAAFKCEKCGGTGRIEMPTLKPIEGDTEQWQWYPERNALENPKFGRIQVMAVCDPVTGEMKYEAPIYVESRGEVNVVVNDDGKIAFVVQNRHAVIPVEYLNKTWRGSLPEIPEIKQGVTVVELPRGFADGVMQEAEEETGFKVNPVAQIGNVNSNTAVFGTSPIVAVGKATKIPSDIPPDPGEKILNVLWLTPEETRELDTICGFTDAILRKFRLWTLKQEDRFWRDIGERM